MSSFHCCSFFFIFFGIPKTGWDAKKTKKKTKEQEWDHSREYYMNCHTQKLPNLGLLDLPLIKKNLTNIESLWTTDLARLSGDASEFIQEGKIGSKILWDDPPQIDLIQRFSTSHKTVVKNVVFYFFVNG